MDRIQFGSVRFSTTGGTNKNESEAKDAENGTSPDSYKKFDYIPSKFANRNFRISVIVGSIVAVIILIAIIVGVIFSQNGPAEVNIGSSDDQMILVVTGSHGFGYFNVTNKTLDDEQSLIVPIDWGNGAYEFYGINSIILYDRRNSSIVQFLPSDVLSNSTRNIDEEFTEKRVNVQDMAYDFIGENLYVVDKSAGSLIVINMYTQYYDMLLADLIRPHHIELDTPMGLMFILQQSDSILRGSMDGTSLRKIVKSDSITAMTLDTKTKRIYFATHGEGIVSSDYEGMNRKTLPIDTSNIFDLAIVHNELYWLWESAYDDSPTHHLLSCDIKDGICDDHQVHDIDYLGDFASIKATPIYPKRISPEDNPCAGSGCQHFCLLSSSSKPRCVCKLGWQLDLDKKTCRETKEFMLYTMDNYFRARILNSGKNHSIDLILPTPFEIKYGKDISFDYDMSNDDVFFSDSKNIYTMKLKSNWTGQSVILEGDNDTNIKDIAYDWMTKNLYYIDSKSKDGYKIKVINPKLGKDYKKTVIDSKIDGYEQGEPNSLTVHPRLGYLIHFVVSSKHVSTGFLRITTTNGTKVKEISDTAYTIKGLKSVAIDYSDERLYWTNQAYTGTINNANFNGADVKDVTVKDLIPVVSFSVNRRWMYVNSYHGIYRIDKATGGNKIKMAPMLDELNDRTIGSVKVFSESIMKTKDILEHPCNVKIQDRCDQFCFLHDQNAVCACRDDDYLGPLDHCIAKDPKKLD